MPSDISSPDFWIALAVGAVSLAVFVFWLVTGGRVPRRRPEPRDEENRDDASNRLPKGISR